MARDKCCPEMLYQMGKAHHWKLDHIPTQTLQKAITSSTNTQNLICILFGTEPNTAVSWVWHQEQPQTSKAQDKTISTEFRRLRRRRNGWVCIWLTVRWTVNLIDTNPTRHNFTSLILKAVCPAQLKAIPAIYYKCKSKGFFIWKNKNTASSHLIPKSKPKT